MASELLLRASESPRKWRYTWEAHSHISTIRLLLFNSLINPKTQCKNLIIDLNIQQSLLRVCWFEEDIEEVSLRVPIPRVLLDVESPLSFKVMDDHIEVKLVLLLPVDHPLISNFDYSLNLSDDESSEVKELLDVSKQPLVMDSDLKLLSSKVGLHFYCRKCSTRLTRTPLRHHVEMPSANWREAADNWFGGCCCSFGGVSEKLVTKYANSYSCAEGTCLLNDTFIVLCKDDLLGCKFPDMDGNKKYDIKTDCVAESFIGTTHSSESYCMAKICGEDHAGKVHRVDGNLSFMQEENLAAKVECELGRDINAESLICEIQALNISKLGLAPGCCVDRARHSLNHDNDCSQDMSETSPKDQKTSKTMELLENQRSLLNGFLGNPFMVKSSYLSKDVDWITFECPQCSSAIGAYPCANGYGSVDGGVRLIKCYISTCLPVGRSDDIFKKYTLERMFTNQLMESAKDEISFRTVVRDMKYKSPALQIVLLNPNSWCCSGYCLDTQDTLEPVSKIDIRPVIKILFSDCSNKTESQLRIIEEWITKIQAEEFYMQTLQIKELTESLVSAKDAFPPSCAFLQGFTLSFLQRLK